MNGDFLVDISHRRAEPPSTPVVGPGDNGRFRMTDTHPGRCPSITDDLRRPRRNPGSFDPADLPSTVETTFTATGDDVVFQWTPLADTGVHRQFIGGQRLRTRSHLAHRPRGVPHQHRQFRRDHRRGHPHLGHKTGQKNYSVFYSPNLKNAPGSDQWFELTDGLTVGTFTDVLPGDRPAQRNYRVEEYAELAGFEACDYSPSPLNYSVVKHSIYDQDHYFPSYHRIRLGRSRPTDD